MTATITREFLEKKWNGENLTHKQIAEELGINYRVIQHLISNKYKIKKTNHNSRKAPRNENYFKTWSADMAYILAFITCDATINGVNSFSIELNKKDTKVLEYIASQISPTQKLYFRNRYDSRTNKIYKQSSLFISSKLLVKQLYDFGIIPKKTGKETLIDVPKKYIPDYVRGLIDGDGSIYVGTVVTGGKKYPRFTLSIASASKQFLLDLQSKYLFKFGSISHNKKSNCYSLEIYSRKEILYVLNYVYNGNFCLQRKYEKYQEIVKYEKLMESNVISQGTCKELKLI
jgi:hypothetical protein